MSTIKWDTAISVGRSYIVQNVTHLPDEKKFLIGKTVNVLKITGLSASVRCGSNDMPHMLPLRALFNVPGYVAKGVSPAKAQGFVVKSENTFNIPIGTAFLDPVSLNEKDGTVTFDIEGKVFTYPLRIFARLVRVKKAKAYDNKPSIDDICSSLEDMTLPRIPDKVFELLPDFSLEEMEQKVKSLPTEGIFDFNGELHDTLESALSSNRCYMRKEIQNFILNEVRIALQEQFSSLNTEE